LADTSWITETCIVPGGRRKGLSSELWAYTQPEFVCVVGMFDRVVEMVALQSTPLTMIANVIQYIKVLMAWIITD